MSEIWLPNRRFKAIVIAAPKTGKTGSIAALVNAGYRVIVAAFDPGYDILLNSVEPEFADNLIILPFEDARGFQGKDSKMTVGHMGAPLAFAKFVSFLNDGKARRAACQGGEVIDLGPSDGWGTDTFLIVDNLTSLSKAAFARLLHMQGLNRQSRRRRDWMLAQDEVDDILIQLASSFYTYHLVVLAHWTIQGPREFEDEDKKNPDKTEYNNEIKEREKDLIPTKQVPASIGRVLSRNLCQHFPCCVWAEVTEQGKRIFNLQPTNVRDSGVPVRQGTLPATLPIETGLHSIFRAVTGAPSTQS
jgi:hypothetical protein